MNILHIILSTLIIYSAIATVIYMLSGENENILLIFGLGIVGLLLLGCFRVISKIQELFEYHIRKRSIFEDEESKQRYKCKTSQTNDIQWLSKYKLIKRYAREEEWKYIPDFSNDVIEESKRNCDRCKYNKECDCGIPYDKIKCKHSEYGTVLEFDKFEKK